jgi:transglutaminase-like putative cysteine protease
LSIHVALNHVTHYRYDRRVALSPQVVRLRPAPHCRTRILSYSLKVEPAEHFVNWQQDPYANYLARLVFPEKTTEFKVTVDLVAEMAVYNPFDFFLEPSAEKFPFEYEPELATELAPYIAADEATPRLRELLASIPREPKATIDFLVALNQRLQRDIRYLIRMEPGVLTPEETLTAAAGSCRDSGWLMVQVLRHLGLAARFVSGYLIQLSPDQKALDGPSGTEVDFTDLHAWCEVYLPGAGWIGFDPTSGLLAGEGHVPLACTPRPSSAAPISGDVDESAVEFEHHMAITRIWESPRVTLPYTEEQWQSVRRLGEQVDARLREGDVRLTMGGEPTFVSIDDRDGAEWNTDALGPTKRMRAQELVLRLRDHYGAGGLPALRPGQVVPRRAAAALGPVHLLARRRRAVLAQSRAVRRRARAAREHRGRCAALRRRARAPPRHRGHDAPGGLRGHLLLPLARASPSRQRRPVRRPARRRARAQPPASRVLAGARCAGRLRAAAAPRGGPAAAGGGRWVSGPWHFRGERMYLVPAIRRWAIGCRSTRSRGRRGRLSAPVDADPFARARRCRAAALPRCRSRRRAVAVTPARVAVRGQRRAGTAAVGSFCGTSDPARVPERFESADWITRTRCASRCATRAAPTARRPRPRAARAACCTSSCRRSNARGLPRARRRHRGHRRRARRCRSSSRAIRRRAIPRLKTLAVTPTRASSRSTSTRRTTWAELVENAEFLYDARTQHAAVDREVHARRPPYGTGGGNHFVLGGATPATARSCAGRPSGPAC